MFDYSYSFSPYCPMYNLQEKLEILENPNAENFFAKQKKVRLWVALVERGTSGTCGCKVDFFLFSWYLI
jgi:hypothetical protein